MGLVVSGDLRLIEHRRYLIVFALLLCLTLFVLSRHSPANQLQYKPSSSSPMPAEPPRHASCTISKGEWVPDPEALRYTNETCWMIQEHQNCMKHGRPDTGYLRWRWRPEGCELRLLDPAVFLMAMRGRRMAFVGDSLARNQMQSLMCLLSKVAYPKDISPTSDENHKRMYYEDYNFTLSVIWSPFLIRHQDPDAHSKFWRLYLDEADRNWLSQIDGFDYVIISDGNWFARPSLFYEGGKLVGCSYCNLPNVTALSMLYSNRMAFRTALAAIASSPTFDGLLLLRTLSPDHFENGEWNKGGNCIRTTPFKKGERRPTWLEGELYRAQVEEFKMAEKRARGSKVRFGLLDITEAMLQRPDGHPNSYGRWPQENATTRKDCVHWCLPGPIDVWNDLLFEIMGVAARDGSSSHGQRNKTLGYK